jgi:hypothetical protein
MKNPAAPSIHFRFAGAALSLLPKLEEHFSRIFLRGID